MPSQEAVDDLLFALKLDPVTAAPEICSLKPEAQALITRGLSAHGRALLSQLPDTGTPISNEDTQGLLAAGEALIKADTGQLSWHIVLADLLISVGMCQPRWGERVCLLGFSRPWILFCKMGERDPELDGFYCPFPPQIPVPAIWSHMGPDVCL